MIDDAKKLQRIARFFVVETKQGHGSPPSYNDEWKPVWAAKVDRIEINRNATPSKAVIWFPDLRWHESPGEIWGDMVRIRTNPQGKGLRGGARRRPLLNSKTVIFEGFITRFRSSFSGGSGKGHERCAVICQDYRWLLSVTSPIFGQYARSPDDYDDYGTDEQMPKEDSCTFLSGQRAIFNPNGRPNNELTPLTIKYKDPETEEDEEEDKDMYIPIFANPDPDKALSWMAREMVQYLLSPLLNKANQYFPIGDPEKLTGLDHADWDKVLNHIVVDGLDIISALQLICGHIGWCFREDYEHQDDGTVKPKLVFYKAAAASARTRDDTNPTILHELHAPAVGDNIASAVAGGKKLLWSMDLDEDITNVVNRPWGFGAPDRFEFTAELVPAWDDSDLLPDTSENNANLFFIEADLQKQTQPNSKAYYYYYHPRGDGFSGVYRNVGRKWCLNESGRYTGDTYDRGMPFDFSSGARTFGDLPAVPLEYVLDSEGKRLFAPFNRQLLPCLTVDKDSLNPVERKVEFSFDGGWSWQVIPASISSVTDECGIYIDEANLAELVDQHEGTISGGELDGIQLNYWTSLCDDKLNHRVFKKDEDPDNDWHTRVRVTASVQLDQRLRKQESPSTTSISPLHHSQVYDFSQKYGLAKRSVASSLRESPFTGGELPVDEIDSTDILAAHLEAIRRANEDMSISGRFTLERLWLGDGDGSPDFALGDCIEKITGRDYPLAVAIGEGSLYPEIVQIVYVPDRQMQTLITRDLRFAEVLL